MKIFGDRTVAIVNTSGVAQNVDNTKSEGLLVRLGEKLCDLEEYLKSIKESASNLD